MILKDKTALVTGGSRGIGRGIVEAFLKQGARVWAFSRSQPQDWNQVESLAQQHGTQVTFLAVDVADEAGLAIAVEKVLEQSGGLDILVNNAGITKDNFIFRISNEDWESVLRTNLTSAFYLCRFVIRHMMNRRTGSIINMSSIVGLHGNAGQTNYSASKAGLIGFTKSLALEVASRNIRVNAIAPGFIQTEMTDKIPEKNREEMISRIPLKRMGTAEDIAGSTVFLASDLSAYVTGQVIVVDGGMST